MASAAAPPDRQADARTALLSVGVWTSYGQAWHAPIGRAYWAGTERAPQRNGYMEGAVRSGEATAEAFAAL